MFFLTFALLVGVVGVASKIVGGNHIRAWRNDSLSAAASLALVAWAITALAFGLASKEINVGGYRGWRLRVSIGMDPMHKISTNPVRGRYKCASFFN
ncbi:hypothetical protein QQ045_015708 [Rhodiola kirilowii]